MQYPAPPDPRGHTPAPPRPAMPALERTAASAASPRPAALTPRPHGLRGALLWVARILAATGSVLAVLAAGWVALALARAAQLQVAEPATAAAAAWPWGVALTAVLGVPLVLAAWHARGDVRVAQHVMTWLPLVWNAAGLVLASQLVPDVVARALRTQGAWVVAGELGDGHAATRVMAALGHEAAEILEPEPSDETTVSRGELPALRSTLGAPLAPDAMRVAFSGSREGGRDNGTAIVVQVRVEGPGGALTLPYLFDTGASFTTISRATAASLGIAIAPDAPTLKFNTASGLRESQMVHLPALSLGHARVEGLLVSICDECVNEHTAGLLGLNVVREFLVEMDYVEREMTLRPRPSERLASGRRDRAYDIEPVVQIEVEGAPEVWLGRVRWVLRVRNRGAVPLYDVVPEVQFTHGATLQGAVIPRVEPGEVGRSLVEGRASSGRDDSGGEFTLHLRRASW